MDKKTPLYESHIELGGKMVSFGGYILPVQYKEGVISEHMAVRNKCGIFDVSHMGEIEIYGKEALEYINYVLTNDFTNMSIGQVRYSPMCNFEGGVIDDLLVYKIEDNKYMLVPNAANKNKVLDWLLENKKGEVVIEDKSEDIGQIAVQGPNALKIMEGIFPKDALPEKYYTFKNQGEIEGRKVLISRTGYTGEDGFEIYLKSCDTVIIWEKLLASGKDFGLVPCGLGARDTLRLEAGMPLYGHEMNDKISPITAGLGFAVKMDKDEFIGKDSMEKDKHNTSHRAGIKMTGRGIARENCDVLLNGEVIGRTTSGTYLPYMEGAYAMAIVAGDIEGKEIEVNVRGKNVQGVIVPLPFYKRKERN